MFNLMHRVVTILLAVILLMPSIPNANAQEPLDSSAVNLQFIIDQSGSMGAATDTGVLRIDAAKLVMGEVLEQIPNTGNINVGLRVYGHLGNNQLDGQALSCESTELLVPMDGVDHVALSAAVEQLYPVGWTPIGLALQEAGKDFPIPTEDDQNIIILITDGLETCGTDPAAIAGDLKNSDKSITTHVIGFGTTVDELTILQEITSSSSGQLIGSQNAAQLISAIFEILEQADVVAVSGDGFSRESPLAIGRTGTIGDYELTVVSVERDATESVMAYNQYNDRPEMGEQFFLVRVSATYQGNETGLPFIDLDYKAVGSANTSYSHLLNSCGVFPDDPTMISEVFPGGTVEFNICWKIKSEDAGTLVMYVAPIFAQSATSLWYAVGNPILQESSATPTSAQSPTPATSKTKAASTESEGKADGTSQESAIVLGDTGTVGDYEITVIMVTTDAYDIVMNENMFNEMPAPDEQFYIARVSLTYIGQTTGMPFMELQANVVGQLRTSYSTYQNFCGVIPDDPLMVSELFTGGTAEVNFCWKVKSEDAESLYMYIDPDFDKRSRVWFSLNP